MRKLVPLILGSFLFVGSSFAQEVGDKMPLLDKAKYMGSFNLKELDTYLVIDSYDLNGDGKFDKLAIYTRCNSEDGRKKSKLPFKIYDRPMKKSFVDADPTDGR